MINSLSDKLYGIADHLERDSRLNIGDLLLRIKIPGMPTKEQALKTLQEFLQSKGPSAKKILEKVVEGIAPEIVQAMDTGGILKKIKSLGGLANPKVILSVLVLMGAFNITNAQEFSQKVQTEVRDTSQTKTDTTELKLMKILFPEDSQLIDQGRYIPPSDAMLKAYKDALSKNIPIKNKIDMRDYLKKWKTQHKDW